MNYVEHHFGDYTKDTAHLSLIEHGAYRLLLDVYYIREGPLPREVRDCCRLVRAVSAAERKAVESVLSEFFTLTDAGWAHKRCDAEIARYRAKQEAARRSAKARWGALGAHTGRNASADAFASDGAMRSQSTEPELNSSPHDLLSQQNELVGNSSSGKNAEESKAEGMRTQSEGNAPNHQSPDTKHQTKEKTKTKTKGADAPFALPDWVPAEDWRAFEEHRRRSRKPMTDRAKELVVLELAKLRKAGHDPAAVLQQSIRRGWADVFPLRVDQGSIGAARTPTWASGGV